MKLPGKIAINTIQQSLPNLTTAQLDLFTQSISLSPSDVVSVDVKKIASTITDKTFSMRLKKWVEPYTIGGVDYSLFYTEVDHNFKVGDRAFIEGGVYDSDNFNLVKRYRKGSDGYKVIYVDRCKIVLDIKYTGELPTNEEEIDNFVKVYVANTQEEFDYYCQVLSLRQDTGTIHNKFDLGFNNFLYLNGTFSITPGSYNLTSFATDFAITATLSSLGDSFVIRGATGLGTYFVDITSDVFNNSFTPYLNSGWTQSLSGFYNNGKLRMMNGNFIRNGVSFKNEYIYYFDTLTNTWKIDKSYLPTIITEQHFRKGIFKKGEYNQGLYGQHENRIAYYGDDIKWNLGTTLNVDWYTGVLDSTIYNENSYFTIFDRYNLPQIRANAANNGGAGYNYVFNTNFYGGDVINGNIFNMAVVYGTNSTTSVLENYYTGQGITFSVNIKGGVYYNSDILFASMSNSTLISSYVFNSVLNKCKSVNSEIEASIFLNSTWLSDKIVKIQNYEESNIVWYDENSNPINYKMYKFYMTDTNWLRLREFQNFYFQDLGINIPSTELLNFFDDKFSLGQYYQSYDNLTGTPIKPERRVLIQLSTARENRNSPGTITPTTPASNGNNVHPNDVSLPSLDIFIEGGDDFDYATGSVYPRPFINDTIDITKAYILDSDFVSGLFKNSKWVSGNYFSYNKDHAFGSIDGYNSTVDGPNRKLQLIIGPKKRYDILGTNSNVSNIAFLNGLYYDSTRNGINGGNNLVPLNDTYKITNLTSALGLRTIELQDVMTQSVISSFGNFTSPNFLVTKNAQNRWNYVHSVKFENSTISSGIFKRAYFKNCTFENFEFDSTDRDLTNVSNKRKLLLSDIIFDGDGNNIKNGLVQYSHFVSGNDTWNNGIFHRGVWNTSTFTYSLSPTSSVIYTSGNNTFKNGIMRNSTWVDGTFENGLFYKNSTNIPPINTIFSNTDPYYYFDNITDNNLRWSWQKGTFKNGDFEKSNFEAGQFVNGNFYDSNFLTGEATGGNFGKSNIPYQRSRVWTGTFSNVNVINAEFRTSSPNNNLPSSSLSIVWKSGVFNSGVFGVNVTPTSYTVTYPWKAEWQDGVFNNGEFTDIAYWQNGSFNGGKFTSYFGLYNTVFPTPYQYSLTPQNFFAWQNGKFNGGQFGTGLTGSNSTWFKGEFNGGKFQGRYWKDGIVTRGKFFGSATQSTSASEYTDFINGFNTYYYGFWQDGFVSKNKDKFIKDEKIFTQLERISTAKKKSPETLFQNMLWYSGTFSNFDGEMNNSVWLDGTFQDGYFSESVFNPYLNITQNIGTVNTFPKSVLRVLEPGRVYKIQLEISNSNTSYLTSPINTQINPGPGYNGLISGTFTATTKNLSIQKSGGNMTLTNIVVYPGTMSGFRVTDSCIWENGEAYSSDFYFSKWKQGVFDSYSTSSQGNAFGLIWQDGITKYMNAYNVFWENGIWKNGNWYGSPFTQVLSVTSSTDACNNLGEEVTWDTAPVVQFPGTQFYVFQNPPPDPFQPYPGQWELADSVIGNLSIDPVLGDPTWDNFYLVNGGEGCADPLISATYIVYPGFVSDIINNIYLYASQSLVNTESTIYENFNRLHINDAFVSTLGPDLVVDDTLAQFPTAYTYSYFAPPFSFLPEWFPLNYYLSNIPSQYVYVDNIMSFFDNVTLTCMKMIPLTLTGTPNIFSTLYANYRIKIKYRAFKQDTAFFANATLRMMIDVGYTGSAVIDDTSSNGGTRKFINQSITSTPCVWGGHCVEFEGEITFDYTPLDLSDTNSQLLKIKRGSHTGNSSGLLLNILSVSVNEVEVSYEPTYNNELAIMSHVPYIGATISLPSIDYQAYFIQTRFGNGMFLSGIWENGVWNEGYRQDLTVVWADDLSNFTGVSKDKSFKTSVWTWRFELNVLDDFIGNAFNGDFTTWKIGDKVSVGNVVTIDINGNRRLIRDWLTVVDITQDLLGGGKLTLEVNINFPIRSIQKDSEEHIIYITKNVWLNGVFLNGYFLEGVWTNGLFQGYPYIAKMVDSHWTDGIFKGGLFRGLTMSYFVTDSNLNLIEYSTHTGVIQKFDFYDQNIGAAYEFKYNSWIDVNYYQTEGVNINRINDVYKTTPLGFTSAFVENNFYGYPTKDVLESNSTLRNGFDLNSRTYRLGWKWKEYTNFLDGVGEFVDINEYSYTNTKNPTNVQGYGLANYIADGWTFSYLSSDQDGFAGATNMIMSNIGSLDSEWLYIGGGRLGPQNLINPSDNSNFTVDIFNNSNIQIDRLRYSFAEIEAENLSFTSSFTIANPIVFYNNYPASYSFAGYGALFNGSNIVIPINQLDVATVSMQREYFFNKNKLDMLIFAGPSYSIRFKKIRYVETDMIPFTQIADDCISKKSLSLWNTTPVVSQPAQQVHTAPPDPEYPNPGQWNLALPIGETSVWGYDGNLDVLSDGDFPYWNNMYLSNDGNGCLSYINETVEIPNNAIAPDIDSSIEFNYISSVNVTLSELNINLLPEITGNNNGNGNNFSSFTPINPGNFPIFTPTG